MQLPANLEKYRLALEATIKPFIRITAKRYQNLGLAQSKFGGFPYWPLNQKYPMDSMGNPMLLLAQLNFAEIPKLESFPQAGILQFFVAANDSYGMDLKQLDVQTGFRVNYFPTVSQESDGLIKDFSFLPSFDIFPIQTPCSLTFELSGEPISSADYQIDDIFQKADSLISNDEKVEFYRFYDMEYLSDGHKIGGYPYFSQTDPRSYTDFGDKKYELLFQIDSDFKQDIMWGDAGVANFFIQKKSLLNCDFSDVLYSWDCH